MAERQSYLIIGNGIVGATAAELLRNEDAQADVTVVADDSFPVYYRPALKDYLGGKVREDKLWARPINFYQDHRVRFLADRVVEIQVGPHRVQLRGGQTLGYSRLLLAQGARPSTLTCPGLDLAGVTTLRTVADYQKVLSRLNSARRVVVVGSGTLALETTEMLRHRGLQVTHLLRYRTLWSEVLDATASDLVLQQEKRDGVDVRTDQAVAEIVGRNGEVTGVVTSSGASIPCDMVLIGIGIEPIIDFVQRAGIACGRGIKVDGAMHTNAPDIYAAGDVIETTNALTGRTRVLGQWYPSIQQARAAAYSMLDLLDTRQPFRFGNFYNATFLYGLDFASAGLSTIPNGGQGYQEIVADPQPRTYQKVILRNGVPVGVLAVGDRQNVLAFKRAIDHNVNLAPVASRLFAPDFKLNAWLDAQNVPAPILGVSRDGATSVKGVAYTGAGSRSAILTLAGLTEAVLVAVAPPEMKASIGETYLSQTKVVTVGRQEGVSIPVYNSTISRRHAEISYANGQYVLRDLKSTNGTFVNGTNLEAGSVHILNPNDEVRFGDTATFAFQVRHADASSSMLLRKQAGGASLAGPPSSGNGTAAAAAGNANGSLHNESAASKTVLLNMAPGVLAQGAAASVQAQFITNADGSLMLPGAASAIPPATVAALHEAPALVAIVQDQPEVLLLKQGKHFSIGRDKANDLVLPDMSISRKHAEVFPGPDGFYIRDLGSSNGVWVNRTRIDNPYRLSHSDRVAVGNITMYFLEQRLQTGANQQIVAPSNEQAMVPSAGADATLRAPAPAKVCRHCGATSNNIARFCPSCGAPL